MEQLSEVPDRQKKSALLTDGTDEHVPLDLLEHIAIARSLASAIRDTEEEEPLGIALYGAWGQGKSTIGRLLRNEFAGQISTRSIVFVKIDAWKYAYEDTRLPLRRHFLLQAYEDAGFSNEARELRQGFRSERTSRRATAGTAKRIEVIRRGVLRWLNGWTPKQAALWIAALVFFGVFVGFGSLRSPLHWFLVIGAGALVTALAGLSPLIRDGFFVTTREDPAWSIEVFDEHLQWLFDETAGKVQRFIFLIDDLDRCSDEIVVQAIATLQAFFGRPRCTYIVAADETQLKRAVRQSSQGPARPLIDGSPVPADETFLEKIFQVAAYVPRPSLPSIQRYGTAVGSDTRLADLPVTERASILSYLVHPRVASPRQARVIINDFLLTWAQAEEREAESGAHLSKGELTNSRLLLAKLVVLRSHFPWFYELLYESPGLLALWQRAELDQEQGGPSEEERERASSVIEGAAERAAKEMNLYGAGLRREKSSVGAATAEDLLEALRVYLSLTRRTLPTDVTQMQEFMYLRSRQEFANLVGSGGIAYRDAIAAGDERAIADALSRSPEQAVDAARAAMALASDLNPVQRDAGRRALLALLSGMQSRDIREVGREAAQILYEDEPVPVEEWEAESERPHSKLVRWMPSGVLAQHANRAAIDSFPQTQELALAIAANTPQSWKKIVERAVSENDLSSLINGLRRVRPQLVRRLVSPTVEGVRPVLEAVGELLDDEVATVAEVDEPWIVLTWGEEQLRIFWPEEDSFPPIAAGATVRFTAHRDYEDDLVFDRFGDASDEAEALLNRTPPLASSADDRESAWEILEAVVARGARRNGADAVAKELTPLLDFDWQREADALRAAEVIQGLIASPSFKSGTALLKAFLDGDAVSRFPDAHSRFTETMFGLPAKELEPELGRVLASAADVVKKRPSASCRDSLADSIRSARGALRDDRQMQTAVANIKLEDDEDAEPLIRHVLGPASPSAAAAKVVTLLQSRVVTWRGIPRTDEEQYAAATTALVENLDLFDVLAEEAPQEIRAQVRRVPLLSIPNYAEGVMLLRSRINALDLALPAGFVRSAATASPEGAALARAHGLRRAAIKPDQLLAILDGVVRFRPYRPHDVGEIRQLIDRRQRVLPALHQLAYISREGSPSLAERFYEGDLLGDLFAGAERALHSSPDLAEALLDGVVPFREQSRRVRKTVARRLAALFDEVASERELEVVLAAVAEFTAEPYRIEQVRALRSGVLGALKKVGQLTRPSLAPLICTVGSQLGLLQHAVFRNATIGLPEE